MPMDMSDPANSDLAARWLDLNNSDQPSTTDGYSNLDSRFRPATQANETALEGSTMSESLDAPHAAPPISVPGGRTRVAMAPFGSRAPKAAAAAKPSVPASTSGNASAVICSSTPSASDIIGITITAAPRTPEGPASASPPSFARLFAPSDDENPASASPPLSAVGPPSTPAVAPYARESTVDPRTEVEPVSPTVAL